MDFNNKKIVEYLKNVKQVPQQYRIPKVSDEDLEEMFNVPLWENPLSECYGCARHSLFDCEECTTNNADSLCNTCAHEKICRFEVSPGQYCDDYIKRLKR